MNTLSRGRATAIQALRANAMIGLPAPLAERLQDPDFDIPLNDLGLDSLGRMELCIWLEVEAGLELSEQEVHEMQSFAGLVAYLEQHLPAVA